MDEGAKKWLVKTAFKQHWRVAGLGYSIDDLIQDGHLHYVFVIRRYPEATEPAHIMRLFQVTFLNHIHDLARYSSRMAAIIDRTIDLETYEQYQPAEMVEPGDAYIIPESAPFYVHAFLRLLCSDYGPRKLRSRYRVSLSGVRELTHKRLCRLIGADPATTPTLPDALEKYFHTV